MKCAVSPSADSLDDGVTMGPLNNEPTAARSTAICATPLRVAPRSLHGRRREPGWEPISTTSRQSSRTSRRRCCSTARRPSVRLRPCSPSSQTKRRLLCANDTDLGLVAGVFTRDIARAHRYARDTPRRHRQHQRDPDVLAAAHSVRRICRYAKRCRPPWRSLHADGADADEGYRR